jgi:hypothetical protein
VVRKPSNLGPRLEALLDERDHLRIQISLAEDNAGAEPREIAALRLQLVALDQQILRRCEEPSS